jgi:hypothetical protein
MDDDTTARRPPGRVRRVGRALLRPTRFLLGPLVVTAALFGLVYASAGSEPASIDGAQPIDYYEECTKEGCDREEVRELYRSFRTECYSEECWMEEVAELAGGTVQQDGAGQWYFTRGAAVDEMFSYFYEDLGWRGPPLEMRPGHTDTAWDRLVEALIAQAREGGTTTVIKCRIDSGMIYDCMGPI